MNDRKRTIARYNKNHWKPTVIKVSYDTFQLPLPVSHRAFTKKIVPGLDEYSDTGKTDKIYVVEGEEI